MRSAVASFARQCHPHECTHTHTMAHVQVRKKRVSATGYPSTKRAPVSRLVSAQQLGNWVAPRRSEL